MLIRICTHAYNSFSLSISIYYYIIIILKIQEDSFKLARRRQLKLPFNTDDLAKKEPSDNLIAVNLTVPLIYKRLLYILYGFQTNF